VDLNGMRLPGNAVLNWGKMDSLKG